MVTQLLHYCLPIFSKNYDYSEILAHPNPDLDATYVLHTYMQNSIITCNENLQQCGATLHKYIIIGMTWSKLEHEPCTSVLTWTWRKFYVLSYCALQPSHIFYVLSYRGDQRDSSMATNTKNKGSQWWSWQMINNIIWCNEGLVHPFEGQMHHTMLDLPLKGMHKWQCLSVMACIWKLTKPSTQRYFLVPWFKLKKWITIVTNG